MNAEWAMVIITIIYVIATIAIFIANNKTVKITREQLEESRHQFAEQRRLQVMPSLQVDVLNYDERNQWDAEIEVTLFPNEEKGRCRKSVFFLSLENVGLGAAKNMRYMWNSTKQATDMDDLPVKAMYQKDNNNYMVTVGITGANAIVGETLKSELVLYYSDLLDNEYRQRIHLFFKVTEEKYQY
ncbi:MAG: hypothetical protein IKO83_11475 [Oscillospiraceae bacterium]|nr:hypothetical protein [Oscillospiraceae bacterium]